MAQREHSRIYSPRRQLMLSNHLYNIRSPRPVISRLTVTTTPPGHFDGLGLVVSSPSESVADDGRPESSRPGSPGVDSQEHVLGLITSAHNERASRKRVRFEDRGASPRKRQRLASRLDAMMVECEDSDSFELTSEIVKLQMIAIGKYKEENRTLRAKVLELETKVRSLQEVAGRGVDREQNTTHELLQRRGNDLITHGEFLLSILEQHPAEGSDSGGTATGSTRVPSAWLDLSEPACRTDGKAATATG